MLLEALPIYDGPLRLQHRHLRFATARGVQPRAVALLVAPVILLHGKRWLGRHGGQPRRPSVDPPVQTDVLVHLAIIGDPPSRMVCMLRVGIDQVQFIKST